MIPLLLVVLALLVAGGVACLPARPARAPRFAICALAPLAVVFVWLAVHAYEGWPVGTSRPPFGAVFVAGDVQEPKAIYLWLAPRGGATPRAYRLPYSDELYRQVLRAQAATRRGETVTIQRPARRRAGGAHSTIPGQKLPPFDLRRYQLPRPHPPRKGQ